MKYLLVFLFSIVLISCKCGSSDDQNFVVWPDEIDHFKCSAEQLDVVKKDVDICSATQYKSDYCLRVAKEQHCTRIKD